MRIVCLDLEGVLIPEIWIGVAEQTGIEALRRTTREEPNYDKLMIRRLEILREHNLGISTIQEVIDGLDPLPGAPEFVEWLRERFQLVILSDTFYEFAQPFMRKLGWPTLLCHRLEIGADGAVDGYHLRQPDPKRAAVKSFHALRYEIIAAGDSYNDTAMLSEADAGILFRPPDNVIREFPQFPVTTEYRDLQREVERAATKLDG